MPPQFLSYAIYDVFTDRSFTGNPLAVIFGGDALETEAMQTIARQFNLSETVFVLAPEQAGHSARFRIFTPMVELPFAGHPTIGGAIASVARKRAETASADANGAPAAMADDTVLMIEEGAGNIRCLVRSRGSDASGSAEFDLPRLSATVDCTISRKALADALCISPASIGFENHELGVWSAGLPYMLIPLRDRAAVEECRLDAARFEQIAPLHQGLLADAFVYCRGGRDHRADFHARMFAPRMGIAEDPATGSAVAALSGAIALHDGLLDGHHALAVEQGVEMGRPSMIHLKIDIENRAVTRARIAGEAVMTARGEIAIPSPPS